MGEICPECGEWLDWNPRLKMFQCEKCGLEISNDDYQDTVANRR